MGKRILIETPADSKVLGDTLTFPTSKLSIKNRFLKTALSEYTSFWDPSDPAIHGLIRDVHVNMYEKWAAGGFGLIVTGNIAIDATHLESPGPPIITEELDSLARREIWKNLASGAKKHGAKIIAQLGHAGRKTPLAVNPHPYSASDVRLSRDSAGRVCGIPVPLTIEEIQTEVVDKFVFAAKFLYEAGFNGVQIHGAFGYLIAQFLSLSTNKRTDKYGGSAQNRARIVLDIYKAIRKEIPASTGFAIGIKLNSVEYQREGLSSNEVIQIIAEIDKAGFDFIEIAGGTYESVEVAGKKKSTVERESFFLEFSAKAKAVIQNAVLYLNGGFRTVPSMVRAVEMNETDGISVGRPSAQEFDLPLKILNGSIQSAMESPFEYDFLSGVLAAACQMTQAGLTPYSPGRDINEGIMDLTDKATLREYKKAQNAFMKILVEKMIEGRLFFGIVSYQHGNRQFMAESQGIDDTVVRKVLLHIFSFLLVLQGLWLCL